MLPLHHIHHNQALRLYKTSELYFSRGDHQTTLRYTTSALLGAGVGNEPTCTQGYEPWFSPRVPAQPGALYRIRTDETNLEGLRVTATPTRLKTLERMTGNDPVPRTWQARVIPISPHPQRTTYFGADDENRTRC